MRIVGKTIDASLDSTAAAVPLTVWMAVVTVLLPGASFGKEPSSADKAATKPVSHAASTAARKSVKLPGLVVDFQKRCVDIESSVCLDSGFLELIACTTGSKEHESIVAIKARPMHIHAGLLMLGAKPGNPAMQKPMNKEKTRWAHLQPAGDKVGVSLVFKGKKGKLIERLISDFVAPADEDPDDSGDADKAEPKPKFPHTFLFAGSLLVGNGSGPRRYMSDSSGNVISISTFGDELLCLPGIHGQQNGALMWRVNASGLPKVGSKVTLRLRPQAKPSATPPAKPKKTDQSTSAGSPTIRPQSRK